ncbi:hypothetical protein QVD17_18647 [Tagetes erecta]|uniref:Uncharacterized protein n=1 Tax=Tagetes erecta TaxID=13708 RepID=A0AAD8NVY0_TARER|nr:hypothetical protein QVD17_18647 [Tagetes erecta]
MYRYCSGITLSCMLCALISKHIPEENQVFTAHRHLFSESLHGGENQFRWMRRHHGLTGAEVGGGATAVAVVCVLSSN